MDKTSSQDFPKNTAAWVHQKELGAHIHPFASAPRVSLLDDPNIIPAGEMVDLETVHRGGVDPLQVRRKLGARLSKDITGVNSFQPQNLMFTHTPMIPKEALPAADFPLGLLVYELTRGSLHLLPQDPVRQGADINRELGPKDLFTDLIREAGAEVDEEGEIHIHPTVMFGTQPIPMSRRPIRLASKLRTSIPRENLPRTFSISLTEEPED